MSTTNEIVEVTNILKKAKADFTLLHCNSTYPAPFFDIELNFLKKLKMIHPKVGYSGHERGISVCLAAIALGVSVIERHITLDKNLEGPDHQASLLPAELKNLVEMISEVEMALGPINIQERKLSQGSLLNKENLGKSIVAAKKLLSGTKLQRSDLKIMGPGSGMPPNKLKALIGKKINTDLEKDSFIFDTHFLLPEIKTETGNLSKNWGVPVRPHDVLDFHAHFDAPVYEFHISYKDLERNSLPTDLGKLAGKKFLVHAPELFSESMLLDLCSDNKSKRNISIANLQSVCDYCQYLSEIVSADYKIKVIANLGGFSTHSFLKEEEKPRLYDLIKDGLDSLFQPSSEIIPQNMAPFPWHFGGQRYQNIFMIPEEIYDYCTKNNMKICLDTSHLSMYCTYSKRSFQDCLETLLPVTAHFHIGDAKGLNGEGVEIGTGDIDFKNVIRLIKENQTYIVETWQGHKNNGAGFKKELSYLNGVIKK